MRTLQQIYDRSLARTSFTLVMLASRRMALLSARRDLRRDVISVQAPGIGIRWRSARKTGSDSHVRRARRRLAAVDRVRLIAAAVLTRFMSTMLFNVKPGDPLTYLAVCAGLVMATVIASYVPALRATSVDPVQALRAE